MEVVKLLRDKYEFIALYPPVAKHLQNLDIPCQLMGEKTDEVKVVAVNYSAYAMANLLAKAQGVSSDLGGKRAVMFLNSLPSLLYDNLLNISMVINLLDNLNIDGAILHNDVEVITRAVALWCKEHGKPCLHIPHAIYLDMDRGAPGTDVHDLVTASHMVVGGPYQREWYEARGFKSENIRETGVPRFDRLSYNVLNKEHTCKLLGVNPGKPIVAYFSSWRQDTNLLGCHDGVEESYINFLTAAKSMSGIEYIIKTHPNGRNRDWHAKKADEMGVRCVVVEQYLDVVLQAMTCGISYGPSNVVLEAAILNKPTISINGFKSDPEIITIEPDVESIKKAMISSIVGVPPSMQRFLAKYVGIPDGKATARVAKYVEDVFA